MAGVVDLNPDNPKRNQLIARRNRAGIWVAGPNAPGGFEEHQFIPTTTETFEWTNDKGELKTTTRTKPAGVVGNAYHNRQNANLVRKIMRKENLSESDARDFINSQREKLEQAKRENRPIDEINDIRRQMQGSP